MGGNCRKYRLLCLPYNSNGGYSADMKIQVPTKLSDRGNERFRVLYKKHFGIDVTVDMANGEAHRVMLYLATLIENTERYYHK